MEVADDPMAFVVLIQQWEWLIPRFKVRQYIGEYSLVNLDQVSLHEAYVASFVQAVEQIFDHLHHLFEPGDYAQLCLETASMHNSL